MVLAERITLMTQLGQYFLEKSESLQETIHKACQANPWFTEETINLSIHNIAEQMLEKSKLEQWVAPFPSFNENTENAKLVGIVMAGNIPLVGFHDFLSVFISGCRLKIKLSSKDTVLWEAVIELLSQWNPEFTKQVEIAERLNDCDAFIATGSNNSAKHFEYYFQKHPHIIRSNRTSIAILTGNESKADLEKLSDDICNYFGFGCRNVSKIFVPEDYNFEPLIIALDKYAKNIDHNKYKNNYDFQLAIMMLNQVKYMSSQSVLLVPSQSAFAAISVLHYETYKNLEDLKALINLDEIQCIVAKEELENLSLNTIPVGTTQIPSLNDYADGVSILSFLNNLIKD